MNAPTAIVALADIKAIDDGANQQWRVKRHPYGNAVPEDFEWTVRKIPQLEQGEVLLKTLYLGLAPVMRMYMMGGRSSGEAPLKICDVIHGRGVAQIIKSRHPDWYEGEIVRDKWGDRHTLSQPFSMPNYTKLRAKDGRMQGIFVYNHIHRWDRVMADLTGWIKDGEQKPVQDVISGFQNMSKALAQLYYGGSVGIQCCSVWGETGEWV